MKNYLLLLISISILCLSGCAFKLIKRTKEVVYAPAVSGTNIPEQKLNVFAPLNKKSLKPVFIFIHGGNWNSGNKSLYNFFGNRLARKNIVAINIDYPLSPMAKYDQMAMSSAESVKWIKENIKQYGGDPERIYISGHSAGGHLATLISLDNKYFDSLKIQNPIKGIVMIDAAGLDMYGYLKEEKYGAGHTYLETFTQDQAKWKDATPLYHLHKDMPPMLIFRGGKTYPSIIKSNEKFIATLPLYTDKFTYILQKGKHHVPMIIQFFYPYNRRYKDIKRFMETSKNIK